MVEFFLNGIDDHAIDCLVAAKVDLYYIRKFIGRIVRPIGIDARPGVINQFVGRRKPGIAKARARCRCYRAVGSKRDILCRKGEFTAIRTAKGLAIGRRQSGERPKCARSYCLHRASRGRAQHGGECNHNKM